MEANTMKAHIFYLVFLFIMQLGWGIKPLGASQRRREEASKLRNLTSWTFKKLEQKYWAAKDDDFTVVQNRAFAKEKDGI